MAARVEAPGEEGRRDFLLDLLQTHDFTNLNLLWPETTTAIVHYHSDSTCPVSFNIHMVTAVDSQFVGQERLRERAKAGLIHVFPPVHKMSPPNRVTAPTYHNNKRKLIKFCHTLGRQPKCAFYRRGCRRRRRVCKMHLQLLTTEWCFNHKLSSERFKANFHK